MVLLVQAVILIAIGLHSSNADVKHVLDGSAHPPQHFHTNECQYPAPHPYVPAYPGSFPPGSNNAVPGSVAFWWADNNSPFKHAYEYFKKCSEKGNCIPPVSSGFQVPNPPCNGCTAAQSGAVAIKGEYSQQQNSIDISRNPFLNGQIPVLPNSNCAGGKCNGGSDQIDISRNPFLNGNIPVNYKPSVAPSCGGSACNNVAPPTPGYNSNPFLNGGACGPADCKPINSPQPSEKPLDISKNPFLNGGLGKPAFSGNGHAIETGANSFLGVQPSIPFGNNNIKTKPFPTNYPTPDDNPGPQPELIDNQVTSNGKPFPSDPPVKSHPPGAQLCNGPDQTCVASTLCVNGVLLTDGSGLLDRRVSTEVCENDQVCCRLPSKATPATGSGFPSESSSASTSALPSRNAVPSILDIKAGQHPAPGSVFKFNGGAGISPGSIQVISDDGPPSKPIVSSPGDNNVPAATSDAPVFASTPDFSNDDLNSLSFVSTARGPQYLPPDASPKPPNIDISDLIPPSISTYQPLIPTTPRTVTPVIPGASIVSVHSPPTPYFIPSSPHSFTTKQPITSYTPKPNPFEFLSKDSSSPKPFIPQSPNSLIPYPSTPIAYQPFIPEQPRLTPQVPFVKPYQPTNFENRFEPSQPGVTAYYPRETPGYKYPTPSPPFTYTSPSTSFNFNDRYVPIKSPKPYAPQPQSSSGYEYKTPTPSFPTPTPKPYPEGYDYKRPPPTFVTSFPSTNINQYLPPFETSEPNRIPGESIDSVSFVSKPPVRPPTNFPPHEGQPNVPIPGVIQFPRQPQQPSPPNGGCAAALKCVQEIYCTADGVISPVPVILTNQQQLLRVPTTECRDREAGIIGRCCRDPNYVDPWPSANSINGFDDGKYREDPRLGQYVHQRERPQRSESRLNFVKAPIRARSNQNQLVDAETVKNNTCGVRHFNSQPAGPGPIDATFGEIPWQAMVLRDSTRTLLCGGVIVKPNAVLTSAYCLDGMATSDILVKGGEWKLGIDEEPLPFQIAKVAAIVRHPSYKTGVLKNDLALLMLEENLRTAKNIAPICLAPTGQNKPRQCIATGWGKRILQVHLRGAIMKSIDVNILDNKQCRDVISDKYKASLPNYSDNTICGYSRNDQCDVDYGSALACTGGNGQYTLAGIFSWDTGCKDEAQIGGYIPADVEWIEETCSKPLNQLKALDKKYNNN